MEIFKRVKVPTGHILVVDGSVGLLELISVGDYGKDINIKCDAMDLSREPSPVRHTDLLPLEKKWVITISTQFGCSMNCNFCDVPLVGPGKNASVNDMIGQVMAGISLHPEVKETERLNVHFARMGEPSWNEVVPNAAITIKHFLEYASQTEPISLKKCKIHPVVSTMMPKRNAQLKRFINDWMHVKNEICDGDAGLQLSINSTNEDERAVMFSGNACGIEDIARIMYDIVPRGRKITLNFAVADYDVNPGLLANLFNPEHYIIKLTPMHKTKKAIESGTKTSGDYTTYYPYQELEKRFLDVGYDVIVFIASAEEDESRITCGNAILSDKVGIGVRCRTCFRTKKPIGRSAPMEAANGYCDTDCPGYVEHPHPGYLWPDETQEEFGY